MQGLCHTLILLITEKTRARWIWFSGANANIDIKMQEFYAK